MSELRAKIGLEVHAQIRTKTKLFCGCSTSYEDKKPNENTCEICLGFPGTKPALNKRVMEFAIQIAKATKCEMPKETIFARKSYFYPDMSKNYQITQYDKAIATKGLMELDIGGTKKKIRIRRINVEEDPAKLAHIGGNITNAKYTLVDYNRAGMPLCEIVTEPDFETPKEARLFVSKLASILDHLGAIDPLKEGSIRVDANISLEGHERVEVKNIGGFRDLEKAINFEIIRQRGVIRRNAEIVQETRNYDAGLGVTTSLRIKEGEADYGYIAEPDLTRIELGKEWVKDVQAKMPELPDARVERLIRDKGIDAYTAEVLVYTDKALADFFEEALKEYKDAKALANNMTANVMRCLNWNDITIRASKYTPKNVAETLKRIDDHTISPRAAKQVFEEMAMTGKTAAAIIEEKGLSKIRDEGEIEKAVEKAIAENPGAVSDFKAGKAEALNFLAGKIMQITKGKADPDAAIRILREMLK